VRWNCKAAKCGSCSAEVNGKPSLMCKSRMDHFPPAADLGAPDEDLPVIRDLVTDVSWNYEVNKRSSRSRRREREWRWQQSDVDRVQEFRKCIECFLCQDVCHVLRSHELKNQFAGRASSCASRARDAPDGRRRPREFLKDERDSACATSPSAAPRCAPRASTSPTTRIIPLKERVVDSFYDRW
jgi:succinate dehydrogenase / fumarate reductase iron-sulfur subunit